jgi:hypothetical protein
MGLLGGTGGQVLGGIRALQNKMQNGFKNPNCDNAKIAL